MSGQDTRSVPRWLPPLTIGGLWLFHTLANWIWLNKNVMTRGWDRVGALINSLYYYDTLSPLTWQALFKASVQDSVRPPLFGLSMAAMYKIFGVSADAAVMVNAGYWAILLVACYGLGTRLGGKRLGLLNATLTALLPLVYSMSRYAYFEFSLTALAALSLYLLFATAGFRRRGVALLLGVSLALGTLIKRTFPVFVFGALVVVLFQAGLPRKLWAARRSLWPPHWRKLGLALVGGLLLSALWYWPNRALAQTLFAGSWLFPLWWGLWAATIYLLWLPATVVTNLLSCCAVMVALASLWYLPHSDFVRWLLEIGWGVNDPRGRVVDLGALSTYTEYLSSITFGFSPVFILLLLLSLALLLFHRLATRRRLLPKGWWASPWFALVVTLVVAYLIFSLSIYKEPRAITPLLPILGTLLGGALLALPWRWLRRALIAFAVLFGLVQFFATSFTETHWLVTETNFARPLFGQRGIFAQGLYLELPDSGLNDPGYYIADEVLARVDADRRERGWEEASLGVVADSSHVHLGMFVYAQMVGYPAIRVESPILAYPNESAYSMVYRYDYILVLDRKNRVARVRETADLILGERRHLFEQAFVLDTAYTLPNGSHAYLYRRRQRPAPDLSEANLYDAARFLLDQAGPEDRIFLCPADLLPPFLEHYTGAATVTPCAPGMSWPETTARFFVVTRAGADAAEMGLDRPPVSSWPFGDLQIWLFAAPESSTGE